MVRKASNLESTIFNITIAAYDLLGYPIVEEVDDGYKLVGVYKVFWDSYAKFTRTRYTVKVPDEPIWGTWKEGVGYTDGILGMMQNNEANKVHFYVPIGTKDPPGVFTRVLKEETYHILSITAQTSIQNPTINGRCLFMLLACLTVAIFTMISGAAFNTNAITGTIGEQVNTLMDIVRLNKIPVFIDGESMYESFEGGIGKEFKAVHDQAKKFKMDKPVPVLEVAQQTLLTEDSCLNGVIILDIRSIKVTSKAIELICSEASKRRRFAFISPPFHTTAFLSLINPGNNESIGKELIRRDGSFASTILERGIGQDNKKIVDYNSKTAVKQVTTLFGLKTDWPIQDDSFQIRPLNFSNFALIFKLMIFLQVAILLGNVLYQIFNFLFRRVKWTMPASLV
uniref:Ionotropic glutamate receptor C-terminal domain-containing protein n=2 Tax=Tetranychus urticae TaxID=32264 RepID=T1KNX9_TETUR